MNVTNLKADVDFLCGSTSASYPDASKVRNFNIAYNDVSRLIWESQGDWFYDDSNATTLPIAKTSMVHNQQDYALPSTTQRIHEVSVKDSGGAWLKLKPLNVHDMNLAHEEELKTPGMPIYYNPVGRSILLYPSPHSGYCTLTSGLAVYVDRNITEFPTSATTSEPGFATPFHRILSYAAAIDFTQDQQQRQFLVAQKARLEHGLQNFYSKRFIESQAQIKPNAKKAWRQYT